MQAHKHTWVFGLFGTLAIIAVPVMVFLPEGEVQRDDPWSNVPESRIHTDHTYLMEEPFSSGPEVTAACLECHEDAAHEVGQTAHWNWQGEPVLLPGRDEPLAIGKKNLINNFCIGVQSNWDGCTSCHAGYGWSDADYDFSDTSNVDCLVCHDNSGTYVKGNAGQPVEGVDLLAVAQSVGTPTRENCGSCHFNGGGGNAVKHGDLDSSLYFPTEDIDVHMGRYDFLCIDCHQTENHDIQGRSISVSVDNENQVYCTDCHSEQLHEDERINQHTDTVACQTCHIPEGAVRQATKTYWDWSTAGKDWEEDPHEYLKIKGSFVYESNFTPNYLWYNGLADRYLLGDTINASTVTSINQPLGDISDPDAKIWPFKIHLAKQPYDASYQYLLQPQTTGEGGYWTEFNWQQALELGEQATGIPYSGNYGFAETAMYWPTTHMVAPSEDALQCASCHGEYSRLDWQALGYPGDPIEWGGRDN